jgi:cell cycle checkpoint protein
VEEFPTVLSQSSSSLTAFRASLQRYLAAAADDGGGWHPPIVMIVSETLLSSASSVLDNLTVHRLLGPALYNHPNTTILDFNSIAPTFMQKALRSILDKEARASQRSRIPGPAVLNRISEIGDIRSAVSSLEFLCLKGDQAGKWGSSVTKTKKSRGDTALTPMEEESLKLISQREASLGMFHAVGKIVYNKRLDPSLMPSDVTIPPSPPDHLSYHRRPKVSQVAVNDLIDETGTDISTFICALHENYPPSCDGDDFTDDLNACIEALSDSDILGADRRPTQGARAGIGIGANLLNAGVDMLRQDEIGFQVAARGLLFALPYPVNRKLTHGDGRRGNAHKMLYPSSLRLWRQTEEIEGLLDSWMKHMLDPSNPISARSMPTNSESMGVKSWKSLRVGHASSMDNPSTMTMMSRHDALLHQLPYMNQIRPDDSGQLSQITGIRGSRLDDVEEDDLAPQAQHTSKPGSNAFGPRLQVEEEKFILSDDDIVDD